MLWFTEQHTPNVRFSIKVDRQLFSEQSEFQRIDVFESEEFGRVLTLDGYLMLTEKDEFIYHEMIAHVPMCVHPQAKNVLVIGGGVAGVAAALASAREGMKVCLIEREYMLGGLATAGIIAIYLPLCDGMGHQLISGISEELLKASIKYGSGEIPKCWSKEASPEERAESRYKLRFDPPAFAYAMDRLILENGIDLMLGTSFSKACVENQEIKYCIFDST